MVRRTFAFAVAHLVLTLVVLAFRASAGMARFDSGQALSWGERLAQAAVSVLHFPLGTLASRIPEGTLTGMLLAGPAFFANSLLWGAMLAWGVRQLSPRRLAA